MSFLKVDGLSKSFGGLMAVHDLDFEVEEGQIIGRPLADPPTGLYVPLLAFLEITRHRRWGV